LVRKIGAETSVPELATVSKGFGWQRAGMTIYVQAIPKPIALVADRPGVLEWT
jgi:hypothetical protein